MDLPGFEPRSKTDGAKSNGSGGRFGPSTGGNKHRSAEELLARMLAKVDELCAERDRQGARSGASIPARTKSSTPGRAALPVMNTYRRILRAADQHFPHGVALPEDDCTGANFHKLPRFCEDRKLSLLRHGHSLTWRHEYH
jgi:hypothetical protein